MKTVQAAHCDLLLVGEHAMAGCIMKRLTLALVLVGALLASMPTKSSAQAFAFSVGSGGHHHHGGWGFSYGYGPWWGGPGWWGPPPIVYAPPPIVQPVVQPVYIQPQTIAPVTPPIASPYTSSPAPSPNVLAANTAPSLAGSTTNDDRIVIRNNASAQLPVSFLVDGQDVDLADGATRTFVGRSHRTIQYDRGGRFGSTQQDLTGGQYEFRITSTGWDLVRRPDLVPSSRTAVRANTLPDSAGVAR
jgi:hypothetical protein